ncbi:asparagine synthase-related protein [Sphingomonas sp. MMS24-J45]|uniref:asparagine synthase-related protein n=1 Tax=Sphingomonas sp. MMS24-J45 TaxID=3238806 RepID=UPI00384E6946
MSDDSDARLVVERAADLGFDSAFRGMKSTQAGDLNQAMALIHGIERRDPTAYRPLLEFCFSMPDYQYLRRGQKRWLARRMLRGMVPNMVLDEKRRGVQAADWMLRLGRERESLRAEIDRLAADPVMAHRLNVPSLRAALDDWPSETPVGDPRGERLMLALTRAVSTARFIRFVDGANG